MRVLNDLVRGRYIWLAALLLLISVMSFSWKGNVHRLEATAREGQPSSAKDESGERGMSHESSGDADAAGDAAQDAGFAQAAAENARLKREMEWSFGGKAQRGWYIYASLVRELIGTDKDEDSLGFALALSRWQKSRGLAPNGVLEKETLASMMTVWQSRRIKDKTVPPQDKLFKAPVEDFYDPTRAEELRMVEPQTYAAYKRMVAAAANSLGLARKGDGSLAASERYLKIVSAFRSPEYQQKLIQQSPNSGPAGLAKVSPHFTGRALDLYVGGDPVSTEDGNRALQVNTKVYKWLVKNAEKFGFYPYFYEPWHWEYRGQ